MVELSAAHVADIGNDELLRSWLRLVLLLDTWTVGWGGTARLGDRTEMPGLSWLTGVESVARGGGAAPLLASLRLAMAFVPGGGGRLALAIGALLAGH
jgi:hypothetical protein